MRKPSETPFSIRSLDCGSLGGLDRAGFSRSAFLGHRRADCQLQHGRHAGNGCGAGVRGERRGTGAPPANQVDSWIAIGADGSVTAYTGKEELGQGISTAQTQLVAEELCVPFDRVKLIYCDTAMTPDQGVTSGSQSHPANFNHSNLAQAAPRRAKRCCNLASKRSNVPVEQLTAADGVDQRRRAIPLKKVTYGQLSAGRNST